jgi:hypothetical protein
VLASASVVAQRSLAEDLFVHVMSGKSKSPADVGKINYRTKKNTKKSPPQVMEGSRGSPPGIKVKNQTSQ